MSRLGLGVGLGRRRIVASAPWDPTMYFGADALTYWSADNVMTSAGKVTTWLDAGTLGVNLSQGNASKQVALGTIGASLTAGVFAGGQGYDAVSSIASSGTSHTWWCIYEGTGYAAAMWRAESKAGRFGWLARGNVSTAQAVYTTTYDSFPAGSQATSAVVDILVVSGGTATLYRDGVSLGSVSVSTPAALGGDFGFGYSAYGSNPCRDAIAKAGLIDRAINATEIADLTAWGLGLLAA